MGWNAAVLWIGALSGQGMVVALHGFCLASWERGDGHHGMEGMADNPNQSNPEGESVIHLCTLVQMSTGARLEAR